MNTVTDLILRFDQHKNATSSDLEGTCAFKESKRALKELAKKGHEFTAEQRDRILAVLKEIGLKTGFKGYSSIWVLFSYPKLWKVLNSPQDFPKETQMLAKLSKKQFESFMAFTMPSISPPHFQFLELIEFTKIAFSLDIAELKPHFQFYLNRPSDEFGWLSVKNFYTVAIFLPSVEINIPPYFNNTFPKSTTWEDVKAEHDLFVKMIEGSFAKEKDNLSVEQLYRFFKFLTETCVENPLCDAVFDLLLSYWKKGELKTECCEDLDCYCTSFYRFRGVVA